MVVLGRVGLETGKDGELKQEWFDEQRLVHVPSEMPVESPARSGGPMPVPPVRR